MGTAANVALAALAVLLAACTLSTPLDELGPGATASASASAGGASTGGGGAAASSSNAGGASSAYRDVVMRDLPLAYWRLGESAGFVAEDELGSYPGEYNGAISYRVEGAIAGDPNTAVKFDGGSFVDFGDALDLSSMSLEAWIEPVQNVGLELQHVITKRLTDQEGMEQGYGMWLHDRSGFGFAVIRDNAYNGVQSTVFSAASWNHIVGTFDGSISRLYINGQEAASSTADPLMVLDTMASLVIGGYDAYGNGSFVGAVDEVAVYDKALTAAQIAAHHQAALR